MLKTLSIIVPSFNEAATIVPVIERLSALDRDDVELIFVDDGSSDGTGQLLKENLPDTAVLVLQESNQGKTSAVHAGLAVATGKWVVVQDADLEYDPHDALRLLDHVESLGDQEVAVFGQRPSCWTRPGRWFFASGVLLIDVAIFVTYRRFIRDHATCYKLVRRETLERFQLESSGFEGCIEIVTKLMRAGIPIQQLPISYAPRSANDGKKLTASYGWTALRAVWHWRNWTCPAIDTEATETELPETIELVDGVTESTK